MVEIIYYIKYVPYEDQTSFKKRLTIEPFSCIGTDQFFGYLMMLSRLTIWMKAKDIFLKAENPGKLIPVRF